MSRAASAATGTLTGQDAGDALLARPLVPTCLALAALAACLVTLFVGLRDHDHPGEVPAAQRASDGAPPTSGPRASSLPTSFVLSTPLAPGEQVNILAYGNVLLQYNDRCDAGAACSAGTDLATDLADVARLYDNEPVQLNLRRGHGVVVAPNYDLRPGEVALTAWKRLQRLDRADRAAIERFIRAWLGNRVTSNE
jgi:hypothetical protein